MDYSKTVNLPKTAFPMKANLPQREPETQKFWEEIGLYKKMLERPAPKGRFVLHDGPPYSNGDIHIGHALNKLLKDFIVRYKSMKGYTAPYVPGWDNHGMPIENKVAEQFRDKGIVPTKLEMRRACRKYAAKWVDIQRKQFKRLGGVGDWDNPYLTMSKEYESAIIKVFGELAEQGYIERGLKPVHWCVYDKTALAEAEIEYENHDSFSIFVRFPLLQDPNKFFGKHPKENCFTIIWTTTPWTIPANLAVAVNPDEEYSIVAVGDDQYLIASALIEKTMAAISVSEWKLVRKVRGVKLDDLVFKHPIFDRPSILVKADYVLMTEGTGVVHTAPGHGREDFETGKRYGLPALSPVDEAGRFTAKAGEFDGLHVFEQGNKAVLDVLRENGTLLAESMVSHSYPYCWRCHSPLIFRATEQWFMLLDHDDLRHRMLESLKSVEFFPPESKNRLNAMIENSPDWCLSRQRSWGVGIPVFECKDCDSYLMTAESIGKVYEDALVNGSDSWFEKSPEELLGPDYGCPKCGSKNLTKVEDVLDVWFDSGSSSRAVVELREKQYPADLYVEGSDQHRGWFNKSLVIGMATKGKPPFQGIVSHGFMLDADGKAMSKSLGNTISPQDIISQVGADVLRLFMSSSDYSEDVRIGDEMMSRVTETYRRIRNTFRFMLGNLGDFDPAKDTVAYENILEIDRYMLSRLEDLVTQVTWYYDSYEFHKVYRAVHNFCTIDLSSFYLDILKDRLYASKVDCHERRSAQSVLQEVTSTLVRLIAPILAHTAEEVWGYIPGEKKAESVFLAPFPSVIEKWIDADANARWAKILEVREKVMMALEEAKQQGHIKKPLSAKIKLTVSPDIFDVLKPYACDLPSVFIVSQVEMCPGEMGETTAEVVDPDGEKCERCWLVQESVGKSQEHPALCERCLDAIS